MRKLTATKIGACVLAAFHVLVVLLIVVVPTFIHSNSCGAGQAAILVIVLDLPLFVLVEALQHSSPTIYAVLTKFELVFWLGGTLMYAGVGALIGWIIDAIRHKTRLA